MSSITPFFSNSNIASVAMTSEQHQNNEGNGAEMCPAMLSGIVVFAKVDSDQSCSRFLSDELIIQGPHFPERAGKPPYLSFTMKILKKNKRGLL